MNENSYLPAINRLSVIVAPIILIYTIIPFINIHPFTFKPGINNILFPFLFDLPSAFYFLAALISTLGMDWLLHDHPMVNLRLRYQHWIVPALTTWVIGVLLGSVQMGTQFWALLFLGTLFLMLVLTAEYVVVDPDDFYQPIAAISLTALSLGLFLILAISIRTTGTRLYLSLPVTFLASAIILLRSIFLRLRGTWNLFWGLVPAIVISQISVGLHYLPINSFSYGVVLSGILFGFSQYAEEYETRSAYKTMWIIPFFTTMVFVAIAYFIQL